MVDDQVSDNWNNVYGIYDDIVVVDQDYDNETDRDRANVDQASGNRSGDDMVLVDQYR